MIVSTDTHAVRELALRAWRVGDEEALLSIYGDPEVMKYVSAPPITTTADALDTLEKWTAVRDPRVGFFAVECPASHEVVGSVLLTRPFAELAAAGSSFIEVSWHVRRDQWGRGIAPAAAHAAINAVGSERFLALIDPANRSSVSVAQKLGMYRQGTVLSVHSTRELWIATNSKHAAYFGSVTLAV